MKNPSAKSTLNSNDPFVLDSLYARTVTEQNKMVNQEMPWSRSESAVPSSMVGATQNVQEPA